jgi:butyrate kinase
MTRIFVINPGSTSTKIAYFEDEACLFFENVLHDEQELRQHDSDAAQLEMRMRAIHKNLEEHGINGTGIDTVVGRGGALLPIHGGVYEITELVVRHSREAIGGIRHPANYGVQLADEICKKYKCVGYTVNPPIVDELQDVARVTGIKGMYRVSRLHALNLKETAIRHAKSIGKAYEDCNLIVCHLGGGISISAHRKGRMIDGIAPIGEGPLSPNRCGSLPLSELLDYLEAGHSTKEVRSLCTKNGGFVDFFGTADAQAVYEMAESGSRQARLVWDAMLYQIGKAIGSMAVVLEGDVDGIILGGGMVHSEDLVRQIDRNCSFIAPVSAYPGEFEMEALAAGALRAIRGEEEVKVYSGEAIFNGLF